jgi:hypothetical protein
LAFFVWIALPPSRHALCSFAFTHVHATQINRAAFMAAPPDAMFDAVIDADHVFINGGVVKAWRLTSVVHHVMVINPSKAIRDPFA